MADEIVESAQSGVPGGVEKNSGKSEKKNRPKGPLKRFKHAVMIFVLGFFLGTAVVVGLQINGALSFMGLLNGDAIQTVTTIDGTVVKQQIEEIGELASISYDYTDIVEQSSNNELFGIGIPLTSKEFLLTYSGHIKAGVDMNKAEVSVEGMRVTITLPQAKILSHEIDEDSVRYWDLKNDVFNKIKWEDRQEARKTLKHDQEEKVAENGLLDRADEQAREGVEAFSKSFLPEGYSVAVMTEGEESPE